ERDPEHEEWIGTAAALRLGTLPQLRARGWEGRGPGLLVLRRVALCARLDQARLHLPDQVGILRERLGELRLHASFAVQLVCVLLQLVGRALDFLISRGHFFAGGSSPVSVRQICAAVRRETIVAAAPSAP